MSQQIVHVLRDATAWGTASGGGIGRSVAVALARHGAQVVVTGRRVEPLNETARLIEEAGGKAVVKSMDLTDRASLLQLGEAVDQASGGRLAFLIHCAGPYSVGGGE